MIVLKSATEIEKMRQAGVVVAEALSEIRAAVKPDVTTGEINRLADSVIMKRGATCAFPKEFPGTICASVNEELVHGIPGKRVLKEGDILSVDLAIRLNGVCADAAETFPVGKVRPEVERFLKISKQSLEKGIEQFQEENYISDISRAIQQCLEGAGYGVIRDYVGHGIGRKMWESPQVPNYVTGAKGTRIRRGMVLAIEPMSSMGYWEVKTLDDQWTVVSGDGSLTSHFEHTIALTDNGPEVLTGTL
ncbi:MAG: type I methionyl aminopeptidase [bacterium]|jgi:methionyl aminopeptidase|nr:type I methionyl aminopeptidase [bacterium]